DHRAVAERGREAGRALGEDPVATIRGVGGRALDLVRSTDGDALIAIIGERGMRFEEYVRTRTLELVVHGIDLARAIGLALEPPLGPLGSTVELVADAGVRTGHGVDVLMALTGRAPRDSISIF